MMPSAFAVLAEDNRRRMVDLLRVRRRSVGELVDALELAQPAVSKHLAVLKAAGMVAVEPEAQQRFYTLRPGPFRELDAWIAPYRKLWNSRLDALEQGLAEIPPAPPAKRKRAKR